MDKELATALNELSESARINVARLNERVDKFETRLNRPGALVGAEHSTSGEKSHAYKVYENYLRRGPESLESGDRKALIASDDTAGGFLAPAEMVTEILRNVVLFS